MKGYASIEGPLQNLLKEVPIPARTKKHRYQCIMKGYKLGGKWTANHTKTFLALKVKLVSEPILSAPRYDGTLFILTTDGCVNAFAGVLSQRITMMLPGGTMPPPHSVRVKENIRGGIPLQTLPSQICSPEVCIRQVL